jgi:uncharacterized membrane protein YqaE (UPF0057 family)
MKTKILYSAAFAFILSSLLTSCAFLQKEEFAQRKYYNFPLTKHSLEGAQTEHSLVPFQKTVTEKISAKEETLSSEEITTASVAKKQVSAAYKETQPFYSETYAAKSVTENKIKNEPPVISLKRTEIFKIAREKMAHSASNSDAMLILELILAVILPPLAILLKSGGKVGKWFWITLLLCILAGGIGIMTYTGGAALCWVVAAIIALLFVFGTIRN